VITLRITYRGVLLTGLALLSIWALFRLWPIVALVITAFILMSALLPYVEWLVARRIPRVAAVLLILLGIFAVIGGALALVVPAMVDEFRVLRDELPEAAVDAEELLANFNIDVELEKHARDVDWGRLISGRQAWEVGQRILAAALALLTVIVLTAYLLIDAPRLSRFLYQFVTPGYEPQVERVVQSLREVVGGYVRGQFITSIAIGVYTAGVMFALGLPNAVAFGVIAAFADIIPLVGATIATAPPVIAAFTDSPTRAMILLGALLVYQQFEDRYFTPRVYGATLNLPPLIVLIGVLVGAELFGIAGVLLALPAAAAGRVALDYYMERRAGIPMSPRAEGDPVAPDMTAEEA
jgi:predicted PurR-regulated permease PerM